MIDCPLTKLCKSYVLCAVGVAFAPLGFGITHVYSPLLHNLRCIKELLLADSVVAVLVYLREGNKVLEVLFKVREQVPVLFFFYKFFFKFLIWLNTVFGSLERSYEDRLCSEEHWKFQNISYTFIDFSKRKKPI